MKPTSKILYYFFSFIYEEFNLGLKEVKMSHNKPPTKKKPTALKKVV
jgi:hypothetical protein